MNNGKQRMLQVLNLLFSCLSLMHPVRSHQVDISTVNRRSNRHYFVRTIMLQLFLSCSKDFINLIIHVSRLYSRWFFSVIFIFDRQKWWEREKLMGEEARRREERTACRPFFSLSPRSLPLHGCIAYMYFTKPQTHQSIKKSQLPRQDCKWSLCLQ